ncbi:MULTISPECIES: ComEC/Rec2 family competence protein [Streptomyces]|uniref:ComEC/Rec2 family competence protein n=1 Tax=Streptomyces TaxID=1883 RepID=UPI00345B5A78
MPVEVVFFNVGQGDCTFLWFYKNVKQQKVGTHAVLIDCGSSGAIAPWKLLPGQRPSKPRKEMVDRLTRKLDDYLGRMQNPNVLDYLIITHPDKDHFNLLEEVLLRKKDKKQLKYTIGKVLYGLGHPDYKTAGKDFIPTLLTDWGELEGPGKEKVLAVDMVTMPSQPQELLKNTSDGAGLQMVGSVIGAGPVGWTHAEQGKKEDIANEASLVTVLQGAPDQFGRRQRVLLMADAIKVDEYTVEGLCPDLCKRDTHLWLKMGHHGSDSSTGDAWLKTTTPDGLFVSTGVFKFSGKTGTCTESKMTAVLKQWTTVRKKAKNPVPVPAVHAGLKWGYVAQDSNGDFAYTPTTDGLFSSLALPQVPGTRNARDEADKWRGVDWHLRLDDPASGDYEIWYE